MSYSRKDILKYKSALGERFLSVIEKAKDPMFVMDEMAREAENRGLIDSDSPGVVRRDNPEVFVMDLWEENVLIEDRLALIMEFRKNPVSVNDLASAIDALP